jgi:hypothetical protein
LATVREERDSVKYVSVIIKNFKRQDGYTNITKQINDPTIAEPDP